MTQWCDQSDEEGRGAEISGRIGDEEAKAAELLPRVYAQLRRAAQAAMAGERAGHTLSATALVHEAYVKLLGPRETPWRTEAQYYAAAAEAMRRILIDHARGRGRIKRGGKAAGDGAAETSETDGAADGVGVCGRVQLGSGAIILRPLGGTERADEDLEDSIGIVALDEAIRRLEMKDPRAAEVVRLRFFAGLEIAMVAAVLRVSERTVKNDWAFARAWLEREISAARQAEIEGPGASGSGTLGG